MTTNKLRLESSSSSDGLRITVQDDASGQQIVTFRLTPEQAWKLVSGSFQRAEGQVIDPEYFDRIGKQMTNDSIRLTHEDLKDSSYGDMLEDAEFLARTRYPDWDTYSASRMGGGSGSVRVVMRKWREDSDV